MCSKLETDIIRNVYANGLNSCHLTVAITIVVSTSKSPLPETCKLSSLLYFVICLNCRAFDNNKLKWIWTRQLIEQTAICYMHRTIQKTAIYNTLTFKISQTNCFNLLRKIVGAPWNSIENSKCILFYFLLSDWLCWWYTRKIDIFGNDAMRSYLVIMQNRTPVHSDSWTCNINAIFCKNNNN